MAPRSPLRFPPDHDDIALVLQGGGALGAYQAGVYAEIFRTEFQPNWVAGVSIGSINAALIAGNPPERRVERLQAFWDRVSSAVIAPAPPGDGYRKLFNRGSAAGMHIRVRGISYRRHRGWQVGPPAAPTGITGRGRRPAIARRAEINGGHSL